MNYTENYQLPQWVESDRVLMDDFNAANAKVDQALTENKELCSNFVCLAQAAVKSQSQVINIDCSDISFADYYYIFLEAVYTGNGDLHLYVNGDNHIVNSVCALMSSMTAQTGLAMFPAGTFGGVILTPRCRGDWPITSIYYSVDGLGSGKYHRLTYREIQSINWKVENSGEYIGEGSHFAMWGLRGQRIRETMP